MARHQFTGSGTTIDDALDDVRANAEQQGLILPENLAGAGSRYQVDVRPIKGKYVAGKPHEQLQDALDSAVKAAGVEEYNPERHRLRITATYNIGKETPAPARVGQPSGAAPYESRTERYITKRML